MYKECQDQYCQFALLDHVHVEVELCILEDWFWQRFKHHLDGDNFARNFPIFIPDDIL